MNSIQVQFKYDLQILFKLLYYFLNVKNLF